MKKRQRKPSQVSIRSGQVEFVKVGTDAWRWRDVYRWLLGLRWPQFALFVASLYIGLNLFFAALYRLQQDSIAGSTGGSRFFDCFFFSVQTLATVGYGHMYPQTLYGHIISTVEIMTGIFLLAAMTGLIFVRFSRPMARVVFSNSMVIAPLNGKPTLMVRIGNENQHSTSLPLAKHGRPYWMSRVARGKSGWPGLSWLSALRHGRSHKTSRRSFACADRAHPVCARHPRRAVSAGFAGAGARPR